MFKVNNKYSRTTSLTFTVNVEHVTPFSSVSNVDFEQVNVSRNAYCSINCRSVFRTLLTSTANHFAKITNGYKGEFKTWSNIWDDIFFEGFTGYSGEFRILANMYRKYPNLAPIKK